MRIAVIGLGKIGLPLATQFARKGHEVVGVDANQGTVDTVNSARSPFPGEAHLDDYLADLVPSGALRATTAFSDAVPGAAVIVVVVPLVVDGEGTPDFTWIDSATNDIASHLTPRTLVVYETTLPVGTTRSRWKPSLEAGSGLLEGSDFHLVFSPERVLTGRVFEDLCKYPKLIGSLGEGGARAATAFYNAVLDFDERPDLDRDNGVWDLGSAEAAELAKLAETTYRDVNIGLANQFALFAQSVGIDIFQVIEAANSQPYSHIHRPGISVGGHCIPIYPRLYLANDPNATIVESARSANDSMPRRAVDDLERLLGTLRDKAVVVLGAAYRSGVKETAFSGVFAITNVLENRGAIVSVHDPLFTDEELRRLGLEPYDPFRTITGAILHTDHPQYSHLSPSDLPGIEAVVDGRRMLDISKWTDVPIVRLGMPNPRLMNTP